jgi:hypothetical protein
MFACTAEEVRWHAPESKERHVSISSMFVVQGHRARVGTMAWSSHILSSGSRDRNILQRDVRAPEDYIHKLVGHRSEVCAPTCTLQELHPVSLSGSIGCQKFCISSTLMNLTLSSV